MDIRIKLQKLINRFDICVSAFNPSIHTFSFSIVYVSNELKQISHQINHKDLCVSSANIKLKQLDDYIAIVEKKLDTSTNTKDIVIGDNESNVSKNVSVGDKFITLPNGDTVYYSSGPFVIENITWIESELSVSKWEDWVDTNNRYKSKPIVIKDIDVLPNLTYGLKTDVVIKDINNAADVTIKTFINGQPINHKDIAPPNISKSNNDTIIE